MTGILGGLARVGVPVGWGPSYGAGHGPLLIVGLFVTVIALERAVAFGSPWALLVPAGGAVTAGALLLHSPAASGLSIVCSAALMGLNAALARRHPAVFTWITCAASGLLLAGNVLWATGHAVFRLAPLWIGFLVLTIVGERLRWSRAARGPAWAVPLLVVLVTGFILTSTAYAFGLVSDPVGIGVSMGLVALWQLRFDIARQTLAHSGQATYIAVGVLMGMTWLLVAGVLMATGPLPPAGPRYDAILHAVFVGYVLSTVLAHAPTMLAAVAAVQAPFTRALYGPLAVLHASLATRVAGDLGDQLLTRRIGSIGNAVALALFVVLVVAASRRRTPSAK